MEKKLNQRKKFSKKPIRNNKPKDEVEVPSKDKANDPSWYTKVGQLTHDVATISFNNPVGVPISLASESTGLNTLKFHGVPGIMSIYTGTSAGISPKTNSGSTAVNIAAQNLYSDLRYWNSGHANYDPADLMIYILAMDSIYSYWAFMVRIYGVARIFAHTNRYIGDALLKAMRVDPTDIRANLSNFRAYINSYALKASTFATPSTMSLFQRHVWMYSTIFKDEDVQKAQMYMYNPAYLWKFALNTDQSGMLGTKDITCTMDPSYGSIYPWSDTYLRKVSNLIATGNDLLDAIYRDEDAGIISGDIIKAYGVDKLWKLTEIAPEYATLPVFSEEVLTQIHNTRFFGGVAWIDSTLPGAVDIPCLNLTQDPSINKGTLIFEPISARNLSNCYDAILDTWKEDPSADDVIVATRNMLYANKLDDRKYAIVSAGSELPLFTEVYYFDMNNNLTRATMYQTDSWWFNGGTEKAVLTKFNEYPHFICDDGNVNLVDVIGELSNYTILGGNEIMKMNESAILSEFAVPFFGTRAK